MTIECQTAVIGAGIVGLAIAEALARHGHDVVVIERHTRIAGEVSSRSSEVLHGGLYYPPGSLKARLCVQGRRMLAEFAMETGVTVRPTGKLVVATDPAETDALAALAAIATTNGVAGLCRLTAQEARALEPDIACQAALLSPQTATIDSHALAEALAARLADYGGILALATEVAAIEVAADGRFSCGLVTSGKAERLTARTLVIAAGLGASALGRTLRYRSGYEVPATYPAKGHYYSLRTAAPFRHLIYPLPSGGGLGVHLTIDTAGQARFGPDIEWRDRIDYAFEDESGARQARFEAAIRRYWPGLPDGALIPDTTGVRPKISRPGEPARDFAIHGAKAHGIEGLVALYGIDSPGLTASLAIATHVADLLAVK
ncbi:MAG: NAD(P)/FAD-dependent oxidoreductase [Hyphomicrobium sp.]